MRVCITLTDREWQGCIDTAKKRNRKEDLFGPGVYKPDLSAFKAHAVGLLGEAAVGKYFHRPIDKVIYADGGDDGVDLKNLPGYGDSGIKTTTYMDDPWLRVEARNFIPRVKTWFLAAARMDSPVVHIVGYAYRSELEGLRVKQLRDNGPQNYILPERKLHSLPPIYLEQLWLF